MGHEFADIVEKVGSNVTKYKVGDRVVVNPTITHGNKPEYIDSYDGFSFIGLHGDGGFAKYANAPEHNAEARDPKQHIFVATISLEIIGLVVTKEEDITENSFVNARKILYVKQSIKKHL